MGEAAYNAIVDNHPSIRSHWHTSEQVASGPLVDTPGTNDADLVNYIDSAAGIIGPFPGSFALDATINADSHARATSVIPAADRTYSIWLKTNTKVANSFLMGHQTSSTNRWAIFMTTTGKVRITHIISGDSATSRDTSSDLSDNVWHNVVYTISSDGADVNVYVDRVLNQDSQGTFNAGIAANILILGAQTTSGSSWSGQWSHPAIWDVELSAAEVLAQYNAAFKAEGSWIMIPGLGGGMGIN